MRRNATRRPAFEKPAGHLCMGNMDQDARLKRLRFRSRHRGIREADMLVGGYFDRWHASWSEADMAWFEALLEEQDVDILAWAMGSAAVPARWQGELMTRLQALDYIEHSR
jgi:antitoxin CptB